MKKTKFTVGDLVVLISETPDSDGYVKRKTVVKVSKDVSGNTVVELNDGTTGMEADFELKIKKLNFIEGEIVDWASSGCLTDDFEDASDGLVQGEESLRPLIEQLNEKEKGTLSRMMRSYIRSSEGWTRGDIRFLNNLGLRVRVKLSERDFYND